MSTTIQDVKDVLNKYFGDTSRSRHDTMEGLEELEGEIETMKDAVQCDIDREDGPDGDDGRDFTPPYEP
jgi:hypothetical protein